MDISSIGPVNGVTRLHGRTANTTPAGTTDLPANANDSVQISDMARYLSAMKNMPDIRQGKVNAAKTAIAAGAYDAPHVLDATVSRMLAEL